jgi:hypothetical protein
MPYIDNKTGRRDYLKETLDPINGGELNFTLYYLSLMFLSRVGNSYNKCEDVMDALHHTMNQPMIGDLPKELPKTDPINQRELEDLFDYITYRYFLRTGKLPERTVRMCGLEFYRRHIGPYEDEKITENGDVKIPEKISPKAAYTE